MEIIKKHLDRIKNIRFEKEITIMEICGGHTNIIMKYGVREMLPKNIRLISGPGCPVCVSSQEDIDSIIEIAKKVPVATYGDMMRVPGTRMSLDDVRAKGGRVFEIYSTTEVLELRKEHPDIIFFAVGFETTAAMTAFLLKNRVPVYSVHKLVPPAIRALKDDIDGFINPGHVSTIIGTWEYEKIKVPQVVTGFTLERVLRGLMLLTGLIKEKMDIVVNGYPETVKREGNSKAQEILKEHFAVKDSAWRGLGVIPESGLEVKDDKLNGKIIYKDIIRKVQVPKESKCRCGDILRGIIEPVECPLYRKACTPDSPQGACMVSKEGSCGISYRYGK